MEWSEPQNEAFEVDDLRVDYASRAISRDGAVFELTGKDFDLAVLFLRNLGQLLPRSHIHEAVWETIGPVTSRTLDTHVSRIRNKLGLLPKNGSQLKSVYGQGYRLEQVRRDARDEEAA